MSKVIHFFGGDKGGTGKSLVCKSFIHYLENQEIKFELFDADRVNKDIKELYSKGKSNKINVRSIVFNESSKFENSPSILFESALNNICVVNLPSQILESFNYWFNSSNIFELIKENKIKITYWYISDGGYESISAIFNKYIDYFGNRFETIFVKNFGKCDDWTFFERQEVTQMKIKKYKIQIVNYPKFFNELERNIIDAHLLTFKEAYNHPEFGLINRNRIGSFIRKTEETFDSVLNRANHSLC